MFFKSYGILGQNARNLLYIKGHNTKIAKKLADSKLKTKDFLHNHGISVPETIRIFSSHEEITDNFLKKLTTPFVVKPNGGFGGKGILVIESKDNLGNFVTKSKKIFSKEKLKKHFYEILDGFYSISGSRDKVIIEKKIELDEEIELLGKYGLPDIRIIVFNMIPVIAMLRIPTKESKGKANLHAGACGVGIDIGTGKLTFITYKGKIIKSIPGIGDVRGLMLPYWEKALKLAVKTQQVTKIGYLGCDIVLDKKDGPLILEVNIRPGLEVQLANMAPLKERLKKVEGVFINSIEKGVRLGRDLFSGDIEEKIKNITGKKVLGLREYIFIETEEKNYKYLANIKSNDSKSYIDKNFVSKILKIDEKIVEKGTIKLKINILGEEKKVKFIIKNLSGINIILGLNSLKGFLIDPFKYKKGELPIGGEQLKGEKNIAIKKNYEKILQNIDKEIMAIDKKLLILKYFTPTNLFEEQIKFIEKDGNYIPKLTYPELKLNLDKLEQDNKKIEITDIPLAEIYKRKKDEIFTKIKLLKAFKENETSNITKYSKILYGDITENNIEIAKKIIKKKENIIKRETDLLHFEEIRNYVKKFNHIYNINISLRQREQNTRFLMKGDTLYVKKGVQIGKKELRSVIAHEIEGHYLRKLNGKNLKYEIFSRATAGYLEIDEGIAIYNQNRFLGPQDNKYYGIFERYYFIDYALNHTYNDLINELKEFYNNDLEKVFKFLIRLKRGIKNINDSGVFMKDVIYLNGYNKLKDFLDNGGDLEELYIGKISLLDLPVLKDSYFIDFDFSNLVTPFFIKK